MRIVSLTIVAASLMACGARGETQFADEVEVIAQQMLPGVERAVGLKFKYSPAVAVRTREEVHSYLLGKLATDFPEEEMAQITQVYQLLGAIPGDLNLRDLVVDLYTEQVSGYYDPSTDSLYVVAGSDPAGVRLVVAHELVHALQAQYIALDSILSARGNNDARVAVQAVLEGQGLLASLVALMPDQDFAAVPEFLTSIRESVRQSQESMPVFSSAPLFIREGLIFPYLGGAGFLQWFNEQYPGAVPFDDRMPRSTEQIIDPERYLEGDEPVELAFASDDGVVYEDNLGQFETRVLVAEIAGNESTGAAAARDWGGDRFALLDVDGGRAVVWWSVWDNERAARRFSTVMEREWAKRGEPGRVVKVSRGTVGDRHAVVFVNAPEGWAGLEQPPTVELAR